VISLNLILFAVLFILSLPLIKPILARLNFMLNEKVLLKRFRLGIISCQDLYDFGYSSFKKLTRKFLENERYSNI